jgi:N-acetylglucosamine-6-phosphate deacetylase
MKTYILNTTLITPNKRIDGMNVVLENGRIIEISDGTIKPETGSLQIDGEDQYLCPGFIDVHFHGAMGKDAMDATPDSLQVLSNYCAEHGVTSFYPTTWAASAEDILMAIHNVKENQKALQAAQAIGVHIEGPYIHVKHKGAQLQSMIRKPSSEEFTRWFDSGVVKLITCAPEIPGGIEFIKEAVQKGIRISIGHSGATYDQVKEAVNCGATQATHLFNGMQGLNHREPGTVGGLLADDRIYAQIICDGVHLHPAIVQIIIKTKTLSKVILITDSIRGTGLPDGEYNHKGQIFSVKDGVARTPEGALSGSTLSLDTAIRNVIQFTGKSIEEVIPMATSVPAHAMGISNTKGYIKTGYDADLVLLNKQLLAEKTFVNGKIVYKRN